MNEVCCVDDKLKDAAGGNLARVALSFGHKSMVFGIEGGIYACRLLRS